MENNIQLAICYTVFNGCELLERSIEQIYDDVDVVIICYQKFSNVGNQMSAIDVEALLEIESYKTDNVYFVEYVPDFNINTKENERKKHQMMIDKAKELECSHFLMAATDHFYKTKQFREAKKIAIGGGYDLTASQMFTYYKEPTFQLEPIEEYFMPFIMKLKPETMITSKQYDFLVDPSVRIEPVNTQRIFRNEELMLHHFSMIRIDIENKFSNSASAVNWKEKIPAFISEYKNAKVGDSISYFKGRKLKEVPDYFSIK